MVVMLEILVVAVRIVIASAADLRESLIGATMVNFFYLQHMVLQLLFILQFISNF
ncbi:unnamed protein product [Brassica napus]|uniref:(rape) hypothetical protein n=1 Tax=Brassica napus TaxID=3708 RepID=A0A816ID53_BRANA|nr:unnamed protein product [Brassica napus]